MKVYYCPDCGNSWEYNAPKVCEKCGCPSSDFIVNEIIEENKDVVLQKKRKILALGSKSNTRM